MVFPELPASPADHHGQAAWLGQVEQIAVDRARSGRRVAIGWSWARLTTFACIPLGAYFLFNEDQTWGIAPVVLGLVLFTWAIRRHEAATQLVAASQLLQHTCQEARQRISGHPVTLLSGAEPTPGVEAHVFASGEPDKGQLQALSRQEIDDLDIFGERLSLFGLLNRTSTPAGRAALAWQVTHPMLDAAAIRRRQESVRWLSSHGVARLRLLGAATAMRKMESLFSKLHETIQNASPTPNAGRLAIARWWGLAAPVAMLIGFAEAAGWQVLGLGWLPLVFIFIINAVVMPSFMKGVRERLRPWIELEPVMTRLQSYAVVAARVLPREGELGELRERFEAVNEPDCLPALQRRMPLVYLGLAGFIHTIIDVLVFWDVQILALIQGPLLRHRDRLLRMISAVGDLETICSLSCLAAEQPEVSWPELLEGSEQLGIEQGRHPLIAHETAVPNSLHLGGDRRTWVITGSNMSGKSTFLRMTGVNVLLAQIGSAVCARQMSLTPLEILTDLRIRDDLSRKESYFLAEVRQVRRMVEAAKAGRHFLALVDEPFRGTNSAERVAAAGAVICSLIDGGGLHLVATHDAALATLGEARNAANYHFEERFEQEALVFDYLLQTGPARGRNALRVLEAEGYPADVVAEARRLVNELGTPPTEDRRSPA